MQHQVIGFVSVNLFELNIHFCGLLNYLIYLSPYCGQPNNEFPQKQIGD